MKQKILFISLFIFLGCAESIDFDIERDELLVVDGKVSTELNGSYIIMYKLGPESSVKQGQKGYDVSIISSEDEEIPFIESDTLAGRYIPRNSSFRGKIGFEYRLKATSPSGLVLLSSNDRIPNPAPFEMVLKDTTEQITSESGFLITRKTTTVLADLDTRKNDQYQSRFTFKYSYQHHYTKDTLYVIDIDQFSLFECEVPSECQMTNELLITKQEDLIWFFWNPECGRRGMCFSSCCFRATDWDTIFEVTQETMSTQTYKLWSDIEKLIDNDGLVFDTFPFTIEGNVSCENCDVKVLGNVRAVSVTKQKQLVFL
ncbi:MAG: DUF4249 family protein [Ekhidna sp.]